MNLTDPGLIAGLTGILAAVACLVFLRGYRITTARQHEELSFLVRQQQMESAARIQQLERNLAVLESSSRSIENLSGGALTRSRRSQAMQLLRSGVSPDTAALKLGMAKREMRLIATISNILLPD
jgi:ABC-type cobalamin transport system ATPase subunit